MPVSAFPTKWGCVGGTQPERVEMSLGKETDRTRVLMDSLESLNQALPETYST